MQCKWMDFDFNEHILMFMLLIFVLDLTLLHPGGRGGGVRLTVRGGGASAPSALTVSNGENFNPLKKA